jgi:hypothetical protein
MRQSFVSEPDGAAEAIFDQLHNRKLWQRSIWRNPRDRFACPVQRFTAVKDRPVQIVPIVQPLRYVQDLIASAMFKVQQFNDEFGRAEVRQRDDADARV